MGYQRGVTRVRLGSWTPARAYTNRANGIPEGRGESAPGVRDLLARVRLGLWTCWRECACGWGLAGKSVPWVVDSRKGVPLIAQMGYQSAPWAPTRVYPNRANGIPEGRGESAPGVRDLLARVRLRLGTGW
jgi:hypothetical protein